MVNIAVITESQLKEVFSLIAAGTPAKKAVASCDLAYNTVMARVRADPELWNEYMRARHTSAHHHIDEIVDISDTELDPQRARIRVEARIKYAEKVNPREYGPRLDVAVEERPSIREAMALAATRARRTLSERDQQSRQDTQAIDAEYTIVPESTDNPSGDVPYSQADLVELFGSAAALD